MRYILIFCTTFLLCNFSSAQRPPMQGNPGFFIDDYWKPKKFKSIKKTIKKKEIVEKSSVKISVDLNEELTKISPYIFGNNIGHWLNGKKVLEHPNYINQLKDIGLSVLRYPGGNASNDFFWDSSSLEDCPDGTPDTIFKSDFKKYTTPKFGLKKNGYTPDQFYETLLRTGSTGSICINYSLALYNKIEDEKLRLEIASDYAAEWVREANIKKKLNIKFWEIGNENWGPWQAGYNVKGRGIISPKKYGEHCRVFINKMKAVDPTIKIGVVGYQKPKSNKYVTKNWNKEVIPEIIDVADFYILHDYYTKYGAIIDAEEMLASVDTTYSHIKVVNDAIIEFTDKEKNFLPIALTEFNTRSNATISKQDGAANVSHASGLFFAHVLGEIIRQGYGMAMMWDVHNGYHDGKDHGMFASKKETDVDWLTPHPSFYHYFFYNKIFGDTYFESKSNNSKIRLHTSTFSSGEIGMVLINTSNLQEIVEIDLKNKKTGDKFYYYEISSDDPNSRTIKINNFETDKNAGGPTNYFRLPAFEQAKNSNSIKLKLNPFTAIYIVVSKP